jgi:hypothetical protein
VLHQVETFQKEELRMTKTKDRTELQLEKARLLAEIQGFSQKVQTHALTHSLTTDIASGSPVHTTQQQQGQTQAQLGDPSVAILAQLAKQLNQLAQENANLR